MTLNAELVLNYLKQHYGEEFSKQQLVDALGINIHAVSGTISGPHGLEKKGFVVTTREEEVELEPATETRKAKTKIVKYHTLTEEGLSYDPIEEAKTKKKK